MTFAHPKTLWLLTLLVPALAVFFLWSWRRKQALIARFIHSRLVEQLLVGVSPARQKFRLALLILSVVLLLLALAQPQWGFRWEEAKQRGLDILVAIDTSRSMLAEDLKPNRLERAKLAALDLLQLTKSDRLGLVAFAGSAFLQCPLTLDEDAFSQSVNALQIGIIPQGGTALGETIDTCVKAFKEEGDNHKVIVLITDGEDHEEGAVAAAQRAQKDGVRIFTLGIGSTDGELLRITGANQKTEFIRDPDGNIVKSRLNERLLQEIAGAADGFYLSLQNTKTIQMLYDRGLAPLPRKEFTDKLVRRSHDRFQIPLILALLCLVLEIFFPERKTNSTRATATVSTNASANANANAMREAVALLLFLFLPASLLASPASARREYESGRYSEAQKEYQRLLEKKPDDDRLQYNAGAAAYRAEDYETAAKHFSTAKTSRDLQLQQRAFYNLANTLFRRGENSTEPDEKTTAWDDAIKNYDGALKLNAQDKDAEFNRDLVKQRLEELKKQQQEKKQQDQQKDGKDPKDQNDQGKPDDKQDGQNQQKKDQPKPDQQKPGDDKPKDQKPGKDEKKDQDKGKPDEQKKPDKPDGKQPDKDQAGKNQSPQKPGDKGDPASARQGGSQQAMLMTPEQARQLLDSQKGEEKTLIIQPAMDKPKSSNRLLKDW